LSTLRLTRWWRRDYSRFDFRERVIPCRSRGGTRDEVRKWAVEGFELLLLTFSQWGCQLRSVMES
jgi:hypothetical protein